MVQTQYTNTFNSSVNRGKMNHLQVGLRTESSRSGTKPGFKIEANLARTGLFALSKLPVVRNKPEASFKKNFKKSEMNMSP